MAEAKKVGRPMGKLHQDDVRKKIQVSQLINVLENHALSNDESELSASRLKAIQILLGKSLPDLSSVQITGDEDKPLMVQNNVNLFGELVKSIKLKRQAGE